MIRPGPVAGEALVPCTCGELVQGVLGGVPFLVSCPIDRYSRVRVTLNADGRPEDGCVSQKARRACAATLALFGIGNVPFTVDVTCPLPPSKGFGTSTADVVGAIAATACALGAVLSPEEMARLAVSVEPSDGTMFPGLALFDHREGSRWEALGATPPMLVAVLEFDGVVDTVDYNARLDLAGLRSLEPDHTSALELLREGLRRGRIDLVGQAATTSALANQRLLPKPQLEDVVALACDCRALGICAAHSGTALGVLFGPGETDRARRLLAMTRRRLAGLERGWISMMVGGGARVLRGHGLRPWDGSVSRRPAIAEGLGLT